jgi:hypothetical protein
MAILKSMASNLPVTQTYPIECKGRDDLGAVVLATPVPAKVVISQRVGSNMISSIVKCPYNTGAHGERCKASHPDSDKEGAGVLCPYSFDIPYALEKRR